MVRQNNGYPWMWIKHNLSITHSQITHVQSHPNISAFDQASWAVFPDLAKIRESCNFFTIPCDISISTYKIMYCWLLVNVGLATFTVTDFSTREFANISWDYLGALFLTWKESWTMSKKVRMHACTPGLQNKTQTFKQSVTFGGRNLNLKGVNKKHSQIHALVARGGLFLSVCIVTLEGRPAPTWVGS